MSLPSRAWNGRRGRGRPAQGRYRSEVRITPGALHCAHATQLRPAQGRSAGSSYQSKRPLSDTRSPAALCWRCSEKPCIFCQRPFERCPRQTIRQILSVCLLVRQLQIHHFQAKPLRRGIRWSLLIGSAYYPVWNSMRISKCMDFNISRSCQPIQLAIAESTVPRGIVSYLCWSSWFQSRQSSKRYTTRGWDMPEHSTCSPG